MADNTTLNLGSGGDIIVTEDLGASKIAVSKIYLGAHGVNGGAVTPSNPLPVSVQGPVSLGAGTAAVGTVAVSNLPVTQTVSGTVSANQGGTWSVVVSAMPGGLAAAADGAMHGAGDKGLMALGVRSDARAPIATASGQYTPLLTDQGGSLYVNASLSSTHMVADGLPLPPQYSPISAAVAGDGNVIVPAAAGKRILVLKYTAVAGGAVALKFRSFNSFTSNYIDLTGAMPLAANAGVGGAFCPVGHFATNPGEALTVNLSGAVTVAGHLTYLAI